MVLLVPFFTFSCPKFRQIKRYPSQVYLVFGIYFQNFYSSFWENLQKPPCFEYTIHNHSLSIRKLFFHNAMEDFFLFLPLGEGNLIFCCTGSRENFFKSVGRQNNNNNNNNNNNAKFQDRHI